jgi:hypothetical protein
MAKLSDFQKPAIPVSIAVDANVMDRNAKASASRVNWRNTKITEQGGAIESDPFRNIPLFASLHDRRTRAHHALDEVIDIVESNPSDEPEEDEDAEPEEASDGQWLQSLQRQLDEIARDSDDALDVAADVRRDRERQRFVTADTHTARVISPRKTKAGHTSGYVNDSQFIAEHLDPSMLCSDAEAQLHDISFERQADDANRGYWSGLFYFLKSQPQGSRIRDIENKACLSSLLMRTVGGMHGAFGV